MKSDPASRFLVVFARNGLAVMKTSVKFAARQILPSRVRLWLRKQQRNLSFWPPIGWVRFGNLRRVTPISPIFGLDRGQSIDRYYIDKFLMRHTADINGNVLEVAENRYTRRFGGERVTKSDVLHVQEGNPGATIVADLSSSCGIAPNIFDCIILTQTLQHIYDGRAAIQTLYRILKPAGVLLATFPGISQISRYDMERWGDYWRFTTLSARKLFEEAFQSTNVRVEAYGNVLAASAFLQGIATEELRREELDHVDPDYEMLITVRAVKSEKKS
jgi:SAM-dependent methyltransferase